MTRNGWYDLLDGTITIPIDVHDSFDQSSLLSFYRNPNDPRWAEALCRVLYHESLHFWQFLASSFIANIVAEQWHNLRYPGTIQKGRSKLLSEAGRRRPGFPFTANDLIECWARYWDVHTRSPAKIAKEDSIPLQGNRKTLEVDRGIGVPVYTGEAFDLVMQNGEDCRKYGAPYRWILERASGDSYFVNVTFPIIMYWSFGTRDPVAVLLRSYEIATESTKFRDFLKKHKTGNISLDWLIMYRSIVGDVIDQALQEIDAGFVSGFEVIAQTVLNSHPLFPKYLDQHAQFIQFLQQVQNKGVKLEADDTNDLSIFTKMEALAASEHFVLSLPGLPDYRNFLGSYFPPPRIKFNDSTYYATILGDPNSVNYEGIYGGLDLLIDVFLRQ